MANIILMILWGICLIGVVALLVLEVIRCCRVKIGDIDPRTIPRVSTTNYCAWAMGLAVCMLIINSIRIMLC